MLLMVPACGEPDRGPSRAPEDTICVDHSRLSAAALNKQRSQAVAAAHAIAKQSNTGLLPSDRAGTDAEATRTTFSRLRYALNKYGTLRVLYSTKLARVIAGAKTSAPEQTARLFLDAHPALLGLDSVKDTLVLRQIKKRPAGGHYVTFGQQHQGVDCEGSFVTVLLDGKARVKGFVGDVLPGITASPVASVNAAAAVAKVGAIKAAGPHTATGSPQLVYADQLRGTGAISEGDTSVYYTSYNGSSWTAVQQLATVEPNQVLMTQFRPESRYYAGRIWLFLTTAGGWGLSQVSFLPTGSGGVSGLSPTVALRQTDYLWDPVRTYTATVQHGEHLRLYYSYAGGSTWHIAKAGEG